MTSDQVGFVLAAIVIVLACVGIVRGGGPRR